MSLDGLACYMGFSEDDVELDLNMYMRKVRRGTNEISAGSSIVSFERVRQRNLQLSEHFSYQVPTRSCSMVVQYVKALRAFRSGAY